MEHCAARRISNLPPLDGKHLYPSLIQFESLRCKTKVSLLHNQTRFSSELLCHRNSSLRSTRSDEISTESDDVIRAGGYGSHLSEEPQESLTDNPMQLFKFLEDLYIKLDYEETYSILVFGGGGAVALWLVAAVIGAIDSVPVLPKVLELVGLGYTLRFTSRYLILKKNRDELFAQVELIKQQILGLEDD